MDEAEQAPQEAQQVAADEAKAVDEAALKADDARPEREIVLPPELIAEIGRPNVPAPRYLRLRRALVGLGLLAVTWGCVVLVILLANVLLADLSGPLHRTLHLLLDLLGVLTILWLAVMALASLVAAAFSFSLAVTRRDW